MYKRTILYTIELQFLDLLLIIFVIEFEGLSRLFNSLMCYIILSEYLRIT